MGPYWRWALIKSGCLLKKIDEGWAFIRGGRVIE